jgi:hypothetical protein
VGANKYFVIRLVAYCPQTQYLSENNWYGYIDKNSLSSRRKYFLLPFYSKERIIRSLMHRIYAVELRINSSKYSTFQDKKSFLPWDLWSKTIRQLRFLVLGDLFHDMKEICLSFVKLIVSNEHKKKWFGS